MTDHWDLCSFYCLIFIFYFSDFSSIRDIVDVNMEEQAEQTQSTRPEIIFPQKGFSLGQFKIPQKNKVLRHVLSLLVYKV